jgi:hypothetical protein
MFILKCLVLPGNDFDVVDRLVGWDAQRRAEPSNPDDERRSTFAGALVQTTFKGSNSATILRLDDEQVAWLEARGWL